ncbi:hypothetical protein TNCV_2303091 [Trichonephila clavipes]|nr:hypothetical protein TNCV_2303091 [Trichonephila clavipes]
MVSLLLLIGTQTVPGSPQFVFRSLRGLPLVSIEEGAPSKIQSPSRWRGFTTAFSKSPSSLSDPLAPLISTLSHPIHRLIILLIFCPFAAPVGFGSLCLFFFCRPVGLNSFDLLSLCRPCRSRHISSLAQ